MRPLAFVMCFMLSGCIGPVAKYGSPARPALYETRGTGVNIGNKPQVSEMREIRGEVYIY